METFTEPALREPIHITFFGEFSLCAGKIRIDDSLNRSRKMWNMLAYLVSHRERAIPQREFVTMLWGESAGGRDTANALKTLLYRIRGFIEPLEQKVGLPLILSQRGAYRWNDKAACESDADRFEAICGQLQAEGLSDGEYEALCREAIGLYRGRFFAKLDKVPWISVLSAHYHGLYLDLADRLAGLLTVQGRLGEVTELCGRVLAIDPCDERIHCHCIRALLSQGAYDEARRHYEKATDLLYRHLRARPSEALRALSDELMKVGLNRELETDLWKIRDELGGNEAGEGAFVCDYGFFKEAYRLELRRSTRLGRTMMLGLLTVTDPSGNVPELEALNRAMDQLLSVLQGSLRRGDVVSRYNGAQYVLLLPTRGYEAGERVMRRTVGLFCRRYRTPLQIHYKLQVLEPTPDKVRADG